MDSTDIAILTGLVRQHAYRNNLRPISEVIHLLTINEPESEIRDRIQELSEGDDAVLVKEGERIGISNPARIQSILEDESKFVAQYGIPHASSQNESSPASTSPSFQYDAFICHASEDKGGFVRPLADYLTEQGLNVWYDEFELEIGDSIRESIDEGLAKSRYGIVVLSPYFFDKDWTKYELNGLTAKEFEFEKTIPPIWLNIGKLTVLDHSPPLADIKAIDATDKEIPEVGEQLQSVISG